MQQALGDSEANREFNDRANVTEPTGCSAVLTIALEPASSSVLAEIAESIGGIPRVLLRDTDVETDPGPILKPSSPEMPALSERPEKYQLFGEIARGGMGAVLRGRDVDLGRELAVKVLLETHKDKPELVRRFVEEAQISGQLQHPGVVPVYELGGFADQRPFFTMKLVKGRTLASLLGERGRVSAPSFPRRTPGADATGLAGTPGALATGLAADLPRFLSIFESVAQTMAYAHARGVIHRDLKPSNIMVGSFGEVQVMDWGLAKVLPKDRKAADQPPETPEPPVPVSVIHTARSDSDAAASTAGSVLGTPGYMAPEQARGETVAIDERADVFGLGAILCEILTGVPAFVGRSSAETLRKAGRGDVGEAFARLDACGAEVELVVLAKDCLAPEPEDRPRTARQVSDRIMAYLTGVQERLRQTELARVEANARAEEEQKQRKLTLGLAAAVLALVTLGGGGAAIYFQERQARAARLELALREATLLRDQAAADPEGDPMKWQRAVEALKRADDLLGPLVARKSQRQVRELRDQVLSSSQAAERNAKLVRNVVDMCSAEADDPYGSVSDAAYAAAFREAGLDIDVLGPDAAATKIKSQPPVVALTVIAAVDDWAVHRRLARPQDAEAWKRLVATARLADPDKTRDRLRELWSEPDRKAQREPLLALAKEADPHNWPPRSLTLLAGALADAGEREAAVELLRRAQAEHPGDVSTNFRLARNLEQLHPPRTEEAIQYYSVARGLRPETAHELAEALESRGQSDEALMIFRDLTRRRPENGWHWGSLSKRLDQRGDIAGAQVALARAVAIHREQIRVNPGDYYAHVGLGAVLCDGAGDYAAAIAEFRAAIRLKPDDAVAYSNFAVALTRQGKWKEAIAACRDSIRLKPDNQGAHFILGVVLCDGVHDYTAAVAEFREAIRLKPDSAVVHLNLGVALWNQRKSTEAITEFREAIRLKPDEAGAYDRLGDVLFAQGKVDESVAAHREAIRLKPDLAEAHCNLADSLLRQGKTSESLTEYRRGHELGSKRAGWRYPSEKWVREAERRVELESRLPAVLRGGDKLKDAAEAIEFANLAFVTRRYNLAVRFYTDAFRAYPETAEEVKAWNRYNAACAAALWVGGTGDEKPPLDEQAKTQWRKQSLSWLEADLGYWTKQANRGKPETRALVSKTLQHWKADTDLAAIRDEPALTALPEDEQKTWRALWAKVDALLNRSQGQ
jgi:serine/threonine-protein kinase